MTLAVQRDGSRVEGELEVEGSGEAEESGEWEEERTELCKGMNILKIKEFLVLKVITKT